MRSINQLQNPMHKTVKAFSMAHALFRITVVQSFLAFYMAHDFSIVRFLSHVVMCVNTQIRFVYEQANSHSKKALTDSHGYEIVRGCLSGNVASSG
jgi:hypothetical protein